MDEDVTMGDDSKPEAEEDDLKQYNLDNYDEDESMPGALTSGRLLYIAHFHPQLWGHLATSRD